MKAWSVQQKNKGNPKLLKQSNHAPATWGPPYNLYQWEMNAVFGQESESFFQKSGIIQSSVNTMQTNFVLKMDFGAQGSDTQRIQVAPSYADVNGAKCNGAFDDVELYNPAVIFEVCAYCKFDKVIIFNETSGSIRSEC